MSDIHNKPINFNEMKFQTPDLNSFDGFDEKKVENVKQQCRIANIHIDDDVKKLNRVMIKFAGAPNMLSLYIEIDDRKSDCEVPQELMEFIASLPELICVWLVNVRHPSDETTVKRFADAVMTFTKIKTVYVDQFNHENFRFSDEWCSMYDGGWTWEYTRREA
jgi:hypothetical protein